jgi:hypothetical protein
MRVYLDKKKPKMMPNMQKIRVVGLHTCLYSYLAKEKSKPLSSYYTLFFTLTIIQIVSL